MPSSLGYPLFVATIYVLAVMRVTRLINFDVVLDRFRLAVARPAALANAAAVEADGKDQTIIAEFHRAKAGRWTGFLDFLGCPWCVGMWVALSTVWLPLYHSDNPVVRYVGIALAASMLIGLFAPLSADDYDDEDQAASP